MRYREHPPAPPLRHLIACYWALEGVAATDTPPRRVLPDGCADLLIDFTGPMRARWIGTMTRPIDVAAVPHADLLGVRFRPGGLYMLLGAPLQLIVDADAELAALPARRWQPPLTRLADSPCFIDRCAHLDASLMTALPHLPGTAVPPWLTALERWPELPDVADLADAAGLGVRTLQRRFLDHVGVSPRQHLRWLRFERARTLLEARTLPLAEVALCCGYADQAHLSREFARFAGMPPSRYLGCSD